ncbi:hypothetical protein BB560_003391 [Smittium megazygosporum]|uniref:Uncharacterized protein n=1 Tax=Smittium megazygosporum TaxID=133381 RepID=A0A2T9ZC52_9FUNG|nr:hypothetical protein BB560_003391 [Smittium megazygosporum]
MLIPRICKTLNLILCLNTLYIYGLPNRFNKFTEPAPFDDEPTVPTTTQAYKTDMYIVVSWTNQYITKYTTKTKFTSSDEPNSPVGSTDPDESNDPAGSTEPETSSDPATDDPLSPVGSIETEPITEDPFPSTDFSIPPISFSDPPITLPPKTSAPPRTTLTDDPRTTKINRYPGKILENPVNFKDFNQEMAKKFLAGNPKKNLLIRRQQVDIKNLKPTKTA